MVDPDTREELAAELHEAHRTGEPVAPLTDRADLSVGDAYDVQTRLVDRRREATGARVVGHKVGLTSEGIREQLGVDEPDFGRLLSDMLLEERVVPTDGLVAPRVEPEVGFLLAEDLAGPATYLDVLAATRGVLPVVEVIDSRVRDWDVELADTVADNASSALFLAGDALSGVTDRDLTAEAVECYRDGRLVDTGVGAAVLDHPARAVAWLATTLAEVGESLSAGDVVLSGSMTPAMDVEPGDDLSFEFSTLGSLDVHVE